LRTVSVTIEPDWDRIDGPDPATWAGWRRASDTILYPRTLVLDLTVSADDLLKGMQKNTRYYIRRAERTGLELAVVETAAELAEVLAVFRETSERAGFGLHEDSYYEDLYHLAGDANIISYARLDGAVVAFSWALCSGTTAFYLYGGSNDAGQRANANRPVLWDCIKRAQDAGVIRFDLNGLLGDGIGDFKQGFAPGREDVLIGSFDRPLSWLYPAYQLVLPLGKKAVQFLGRLRNQRRAEAQSVEDPS
jgi:peptidoglycan pentaglycine glycine transferase (the first glycine)